MTYQKIKETVVNEQKRLNEKELKSLTVNMALTFLGICLTLGLLTYTILGLPFTLLVIVFAMLGYNWMFDILVEDENSTKHIRRFSKTWWLFFIIFIGVFITLKLFHFA